MMNRFSSGCCRYLENRMADGQYIYSQYYAVVFFEKGDTIYCTNIWLTENTHKYNICIVLWIWNCLSLDLRFWSFYAAASTPETYFPWKVTFDFARSHLNEPTTCFHLCFHRCCRAWHRNTAQMGKSKWVQKSQTVGGQLVLIIAPIMEIVPYGSYSVP